MFRAFISILIPFILLVACTAVPTATPVPTNTSLPTATPQPTNTSLPTSTATATATPTATATKPPAILSGNLFMDADGNGLRDNASFICPDANATPPSLGYFFPSVSKCTPGQMVTAMEPGLGGFVLNTTVSGQPITATTDANGNYRMVIPGGTDGQTVKVNVTDPNAKDAALAMRYINQWNKQVIVSAYEMNGFSVPEQRLNDTKVVPIAEGFGAKLGTENRMGLMQGYVLFPLSQKDFPSIQMVQGFDHDITDGISDFTGKRSRCVEYNRCETNTREPGQVLNGVGNNHSGIDYGYFGIPSALKIFIYATKGGYILNTEQRGTVVILDYVGQRIGGSPRPAILFGHTFAFLVNSGTYVYPGQIIAIMGNTGTAADWTHLHFDMQFGAPVPNNSIGYSKDFYRQMSPALTAPGFNDISVWTVDNLPILIR